MKVKLEVNGWLVKFTGGKKAFEIDADNGATVDTAIQTVGIPTSQVGFVSVKSIGNEAEKLVDMEHIVSEGDVLKLYSHIVGG